MEPSVQTVRPGRPREPHKRTRIVRLARDAFAELGYTAASLGEIAKRAELTKAAVLHHFGSKESLYVAVLSELVTELGALVARAVIDRGPFAARLDRLGETVTEYLGRNPSAAKLLLSELVGQGPYARGAGAAQVAAAMAAVRDFLHDGMRRKEIDRQSAEHLAMSIVSVHLVYFAASDVTASLLRSDPFSTRRITQRKRAVVATVRAMCGLS